MSNVGQAALTIAGFAIGAAVGFPQAGFIIGSLLGSALFPTKLPGQSGPRLQDTRTTTAQLGGPIMEVIGTDAVPGNVIWMEPTVREVAAHDEVGGKGGPSQDVTTYTYFQSIAVGICRGPMGGLTRIWENGKLVYDIRIQQPSEGDDQFAARLAAADEYAAGFVLYLGDETQMPDPTIELDKGVGTTTAFRGLCYIVFPDRQLRDDQALRHPNYKFEVSRTPLCLLTEWSIEQLFPWLEAPNPSNPLNDNVYTFASVEYGTLEAARAAGEAQFNLTYPLPQAMSVLLDYSLVTWEDDGIDFEGTKSFFPARTVSANGGYRYQMVGLWFDRASPDHRLSYQQYQDAFAGGGCGYAPFGAMPGEITYSPGQNGVSMTLGIDGSIDDPMPHPPFDNWPVAGRCGLPGSFWIQSSGGQVYVRVARNPVAPPDDEQGSWTRVDLVFPERFRALQAYGFSDIGEQLYPLGPVLKFDDPDYDSEAFWTEAYEDAVDQGDMEPGLVYPTDYPTFSDHAWYRTRQVACDGDVVTLASVVRYIVDRCAVPLADIDATDLEDVPLGGYTVTRVMSGRDALEPLRNVGFFDVVESGSVLKFVKRGKGIVRSLTLEELGAREGGTEAVPAVRKRISLETDMPRQIRVHYKAISRDYEDGEQISPARTTSEAINDTDVELAVALATDDQAAQIAEVLWSDAWEARTQFDIALDAAHADLEAGDVIELPVEGFTERARITEADVAIPDLRKLTLVRDFDGSYVSIAVADAPERPPGVVVILSASDILILDLPALRATDDDVGVYMTTVPVNEGATYRGAAIYRSTDGGVTFTALSAVANEPTTGETVGFLPAGQYFTWDDTATLTVELRTGTLESRTEADVLEGANTIAVGLDGRWELVQFTTVEQIGPTRYQLSHLLRGRRGTERLMGTGQAGDTFVLVSGQGIVRVPMEITELAVSRTYKAVTSGMAYASGTDEDFATAGVALLPFSPVNLTPDYDTGYLRITWERRDRLGYELTSGTELPMSEDGLEYDVEIYQGGVLAIEDSVAIEQYTVGGLVYHHDAPPVGQVLPSIAGYVVGRYVSGAADTLRNIASADGTVAAVSGGTSQRSIAVDGTYVYASMADTTEIPAFYGVRKFDLATLTLQDSLDADPLDVQLQLVLAGGKLWVAQQISNNLREIDPATLTETALHAVAGGPTELRVQGTQIFVLCANFEIAVIDSADGSEDDRWAHGVTAGARMLVTEDAVFIIGTDGVYVFEHDGTPITSHPLLFSADTYQFKVDQMADDGTLVAVVAQPDIPAMDDRQAAAKILLLNRSTGALVQELAIPGATGISYASGDFYVNIVTPTGGGGHVVTGKVYRSGSLSGDLEVRIYQVSAQVGRGPPGVLQL